MEKDLGDRNLAALRMIMDKLRNAMIAQLSELAQEKIGRLNFYFAAMKLKAFESKTQQFSSYIDQHRFTEKRNYDISHQVWTAMPTLVNGRPATIRVVKEWGAIDISSIKYQDESPDVGAHGA